MCRQPESEAEYAAFDQIGQESSMVDYDFQFDDELQELRFDCGYNGYNEFDPNDYDPIEEGNEYRRAKAFADEWGDGSSVDGLINYKDAIEERLTGLENARAEQFKSITDESSRVVFEPVIKGGMVGYQCTSEQCDVTYIYLNPSDDSDDGNANVFVYMGPDFDPAGKNDTPQHFYDIFSE